MNIECSDFMFLNNPYTHSDCSTLALSPSPKHPVAVAETPRTSHLLTRPLVAQSSQGQTCRASSLFTGHPSSRKEQSCEWMNVSVSLTAQAAIENATKEFEEGVMFAGLRVAGGQGQRQMSGEGVNRHLVSISPRTRMGTALRSRPPALRRL